MHYVAKGMRSITGKRALNLRAVCTKLSVFTREDAQRGLQVYQKHMKLFNLTRLYDAMLEKAMQGDTRAATWVESFTKSDYFDESQDEIDNFLSGINIPGMKGD